ncbi:hypothetical protein EVAR_31675_1 [Eumeta japonica]|uniref:Uncharacterized protein n=1 Tax=Eumeta variegata TaxID=151549 RepID=A0A4C1VU89_EUMVA|nr:hypothetical protein EVAR_31675_1 [Eumeta japonica]
MECFLFLAFGYVLKRFRLENKIRFLRKPQVSDRLIIILLRHTLSQSAYPHLRNWDLQLSTLPHWESRTAKGRRRRCDENIWDRKLNVFSEVQSG